MIFDGNRVLLGKYMAYLAEEVGLRDWSISLSDDPCDDVLAGTCQPIRGRRVACIALNSAWMDADPCDLRETIVHELLHCHTEPITYPLASLRDLVGSVIHDHLETTQSMALEFAVDAIASSFARRLMMPDAWLATVKTPQEAA